MVCSKVMRHSTIHSRRTLTGDVRLAVHDKEDLLEMEDLHMFVTPNNSLLKGIGSFVKLKTIGPEKKEKRSELKHSQQVA